MHNLLSKTIRQKREYNKLVGYKKIRSKYEDCKYRINKINLKGVNTEFLNYSKRVKKEYGIRVKNINKYERKWIQEVNELKKKLNK
jgi:hypothetical protein